MCIRSMCYLFQSQWCNPNLSGCAHFGVTRYQHVSMGNNILQDVQRYAAHLFALVPEELACVFNHLFIREVGVRLLLAKSQNLPQSHPECPHVTSHGEFTLEIRCAIIINQMKDILRAFF